MEEPGMAVQVRESKHPYDNNTKFEVGPMPKWYQLTKFQHSSPICFIMASLHSEF